MKTLPPRELCVRINEICGICELCYSMGAGVHMTLKGSGRLRLSGAINVFCQSLRKEERTGLCITRRKRLITAGDDYRKKTLALHIYGLSIPQKKYKLKDYCTYYPSKIFFSKCEL